MAKFPITLRLERRLSFYAIAFSLILTAAGCATEERPRPTLASIETPPSVLRIGTSGDYAPFSVWPPGDAPSGFSISVAEAYAADRGLEIEWIRFRWPDLATRLEANDFDLAISGITVRPERSILGRFALPLTTSGAVVLVPSDSPIESATELDRPAVSIAVNAGGHLERVARRLFPAARIETLPDNASVLGRLVRGSTDPRTTDSVDAVVTDSLEAPIWQRQWEREVKTAGPCGSATRLRAIGPLTRDLKAAWFSPQQEAEARRFDDWLLRAEADGRLGALRKRSRLPDDRTAEPLAALLSSLDERLALMPAVADAKAVLGIPIENQAREEIVLDAAVRSVETAARAAGRAPLGRRAVRRLFEAQIESAKWIQAETLRRRSRDDSPGMTPRDPDLARDRLEAQIRPALIYLGDRIARLLVESVGEPGPRLAFTDVAHALASRDLPEERLRRLFDALRDVLEVDEPRARRVRLE